MPRAILVDRLTRRYDKGRVVALDDVSLSVEAGEVVAVLGSNGAGKTTLVKVLATLLAPDAGRALVAGFDVTRQPRQVRSRVSLVLGGDRGLYGRLSGLDNVRFFGVLRGVPRREVKRRAMAALAGVGLTDRAGARVETYSRGMKQRLHLAIGLLARPEVLLLDEPTIGLDVVEARKVRVTVREIAAAGTAVLLTSHNVADIDQLASRVALIRHGRLESDLTMGRFRRLSGAVGTIRMEGHGRRPDLPTVIRDLDLVPSAVELHERPGGQWSLGVVMHEWSGAVLGRLSELMSGEDIRNVRIEPVGLDQTIADVLTGTMPDTRPNGSP